MCVAGTGRGGGGLGDRVSSETHLSPWNHFAHPEVADFETALVLGEHQVARLEVSMTARIEQSLPPLPVAVPGLPRRVELTSFLASPARSGLVPLWRNPQTSIRNSTLSLEVQTPTLQSNTPALKRIRETRSEHAVGRART